MMKLFGTKIAAIALSGALLVGSGANAAISDFVFDNDFEIDFIQNTQTLDCSNAHCGALDGSVNYIGGVFTQSVTSTPDPTKLVAAGASPSEANETSLLTAVAAFAGFDTSNAVYTKYDAGAPGGIPIPLSLDAGTAFLVKQGSNTAVFVARSAVDISSFSDASHISTLSTVPLPAGILLLLSGIGGLGVVGWRRRRMTAA